MGKREREYIDDLVAHAVEADSFFSNHRKPEREKSACVAFLRCIGVGFSLDEVVPYQLAAH